LSGFYSHRLFGFFNLSSTEESPAGDSSGTKALFKMIDMALSNKRMKDNLQTLIAQ
jgi:hypothetical protein